MSLHLLFVGHSNDEMLFDKDLVNAFDPQVGEMQTERFSQSP